ncbi:hypothetical protein PoB_006273900 [Plakobranchus ocellatus]|uniref:Uncharacterized protein n=1 Tax=Plakobranchus ocellatus TaxID=259542 RepID=A0AAV4CWH2_9GAST|nr:hypothetical protein PoB_006273900 [Plakobranchus ocellatus]
MGQKVAGNEGFQRSYPRVRGAFRSIASSAYSPLKIALPPPSCLPSLLETKTKKTQHPHSIAVYPVHQCIPLDVTGSLAWSPLQAVVWNVCPQINSTNRVQLPVQLLQLANKHRTVSEPWNDLYL